MKTIKTGMMAFEVTRRCNQSCAHCCKGKSQNIDMSKELIDSLFRSEDYKIVEMTHLAITGGEPTLVPDVVEYLVDTIIELDISITSHVNCFTNGLIYEERLINSIERLITYLKNKENCKNVQLVFEVSNDQFHQRPSEEVLEKYSKVSFLDKSFLNLRERTVESTMNEGNAKENGVGGSKTYKDFMRDIDIVTIQNEVIVNNELLIAANGNIIHVGCAPFIEEDKIALGNLHETSFLDILEKFSK